MGGADTIQRFLNAGLVDEFILHITPVILGSGIQLFDQIDKNKLDIETTEVRHSSLTTYLFYRLTNNKGQ